MRMLMVIKIIHTIFWLIVFLSILYVLFSGITGRINNITWIAITIIIVEGIILLMNKWNCPLTFMARKYSDSKSDNFDIILPNWLAKHTKIIGVILFFIGILLIMIRYLGTILNI